MDAATFNAKDDAKVDRDPLGLDTRAAVGAPAVPLVGIADGLEKFGGVFIEAVAVISAVGRPSTNCCSSVHVVSCDACTWIGW